MSESTQRAETQDKGKMSNYRWVVLALIFVIYTIATADRANLGVALPFIKKEFGLSNTEAGGIVSLLFLGYAVAQIPAGFIYSKTGVRKVFSLAMLLTSVFTGLQGITSSLFTLKLARVGLGLSEGPLPIGLLSTINHWFPPKEKGTATGAYLAASKCGPVIVPPICVVIMELYGWREIFLVFAIPGIILAVVWYFMVTNKPSESRFVSAAELEYITTEKPIVALDIKVAKPKYNLKWLDKIILAKKVELVDTNAKLFRSWNVLGNAIGYLFMNGIIYVIMAWIPTYLMTVKGFVSLKMGFLASAPFVGAVAGNIVGGWISDRLLNKRRKPLMLFSGMCTTFMMYSLIYAPDNAALLGLLLFMAGFLFSLGFSAFSVYAMGVTTKKIYPVAYGVVNTGGQIGSAAAPFVVGMILDASNWNMVFTFLAACSIVSVLIIASLDEPINDDAAAESA
ncbi:MAG: MFS transporter [Negativicutes bacterium]|nr:MFS transporter [Negativicutes bacterium]